MDWVTQVSVHESASPEFVRERIAEALGRREVAPALLYAGLGQTLLWTRLHHAVSPAQRDSDFLRIYESAFEHLGGILKENVVHLISLGCGDGTKDARCLQRIRGTGRTVIYSPVDFSLEMVLAARKTAASAIRGLQSTPLLCDLVRCSVLPAILKSFDPSGAERVMLFLGTLHNYWPPEILRALLYPLRSQDHLLLSANLAPAASYDSAIEQIRLQYDNEPTREWLRGALGQLGISAADGDLHFSVRGAEQLPALRGIQADFVFNQPVNLRFFEDEFAFNKGDKLKVFHSSRFTVAQIRDFLEQSGLRVATDWVTASEEEALFLCHRASQP